MNDGPSEALIEALTSLWRIPAPGPEKLRAAAAFKWLSKTALLDYPTGHTGTTSRLDFALEGALLALGVPCKLPSGRNSPHVPLVEAARLLDQAFRATRCRQRHLVPLDLAGELPELTFGPVRLGKFSEPELRELLNATRLDRRFPLLPPVATKHFSWFRWLVVEEELPLDPRPAARASPLLFNMMLDRDFGQIEPYKGRFPPAVENALFALLLAPWEEWSSELNPDWRGFYAPWVYSVVEDIFVQPLLPPSVDTLTWEPAFYPDGYGGTVESERPVELRLDEPAAALGLALLDNDRWSAVEKALSSPLFETPVAHFFVRAFLSEGIDEFIAHLTTIEAALGLRADYCPSRRPKPDPHKKLNSTSRLRARIAALLTDRSAADLHRMLFDLRSDYVHGRGSEKVISSKEKTEARSLARRVVEALVTRANEVNTPATREEFLSSLLNRGAPLAGRP